VGDKRQKLFFGGGSFSFGGGRFLGGSHDEGLKKCMYVKI
jgi:hypothetical protein